MQRRCQSICRCLEGIVVSISSTSSQHTSSSPRIDGLAFVPLMLPMAQKSGGTCTKLSKRWVCALHGCCDHKHSTHNTACGVCVRSWETSIWQGRRKETLCTRKTKNTLHQLIQRKPPCNLGSSSARQRAAMGNKRWAFEWEIAMGFHNEKLPDSNN